MIGLVIVTHGPLAKAFVEALEQVMGTVENIQPICIYSENNIDQHRAAILKAVEKGEKGQGVILLTDLFGGTPSNLAISALGISSVEVIAGINLPMLVRLAQLQKGTPIKEAIAQAQEAGRKYIQVASILLDNTVTEAVTASKMAKSRRTTT